MKHLPLARGLRRISLDSTPMNLRSMRSSLVAVLFAVVSAAHGDVVTQWNGLLLDAIRVEDASPTLAARGLAILHTAIYDAVNSIERTHQPYFVDLTAPPGSSVEAAAAAAAHEVMVKSFPTESAHYDEVYQAFLAEQPPGPGLDAGLQVGRLVADRILEWRSSDGASTTVPYIPNPAPGHWRRTPPFFRPPDSPQCPFVTPFAMIQGDQFRPPGPPALTSGRYTADFNEVKELGAANSASRTGEQTLIARFWSDFSYTVTPPGHWNQIAAIVAENQGNTLSQNARLFALLNIAMADAGILCWDAKYTYDFWRPITAIREADTDANPDTVPDPGWTSLLNAPPFPEYTSGHSTFSKAAAVVIARFQGTDAIGFAVGNETITGVLRSFTSLAAAADECGRSRIYGGIHFTSANRDAKSSGVALANYVTGGFLLPNLELPKLNAIRTSQGIFHLQLHGVPGQKYVIQASPDLTHWLPVATNTAVLRGTLFSDLETSAAGSPQFFRAIPATGGP